MILGKLTLSSIQSNTESYSELNSATLATIVYSIIVSPGIVGLTHNYCSLYATKMRASIFDHPLYLFL